MAHRACLVLCSLLAACRGDAAPKPGAGEPGASAGQELPARLAEVAPWVAARTAEMRDAHCERPVLRGAAVAGRSDAAMLALIDPAGRLAACREAAKAMVVDPPPERAPDHLLAEGVMVETTETHGVIDRAATACAGLSGAVAATIAHADACSPHRVGLNAGEATAWMLVARGLVAQARVLARDGRMVEAIQILVDGVRLAHDLRRGPVALIDTMVSIAMEGVLVAPLAGFLATRPPAHEALAELDRQLAVLWASRPQPQQQIEAEYVVSAKLAFVDNPIRDTDTLSAHRDAWRQLRAACRGDATVASCQRALTRLVERDSPVAATAQILVRATANDYLLAALRVHVATLLGGADPYCDPSMVAPALLSPPGLGEPLEVGVMGGGPVLTIPYRKLLVKAKDRPIVLWHIACPSKISRH